MNGSVFHANVPRQLGRCRVLDRISVGGMGHVFRAEDLSRGATVAIKVLNPELAKWSDAVERLHKETRLLTEVRSP